MGTDQVHLPQLPQYTADMNNTQPQDICDDIVGNTERQRRLQALVRLLRFLRGYRAKQPDANRVGIATPEQYFQQKMGHPSGAA